MVDNTRRDFRATGYTRPARSQVFGLLALIVLLLGMVALLSSEGLRAQEQASPVDVPRISNSPVPAPPTPVPPPPFATKPPQDGPGLAPPVVTQPPPAPMPAPQMTPVRRFQFTIDPKTPFKDLLPTPPQGQKTANSPIVQSLAQVPEVEFQSALARNVAVEEAMKQTAHTIAKINHLNGKKTDGFMEALLGERSDLAGLPFAMGDKCRTKGERSKQFALAVNTVRGAMQQRSASKTVKRAVQLADGGLQLVDVKGVISGTIVLNEGNFMMDRGSMENFWEQYLTACAQEDRASSRIDRDQREHVTLARIAALMQVLAPETPSTRLGLVKYLSTVAHPEATRALARLAIFSAEDDVRLAAIDALKVRRERDYTEVLVHGLRYPWPDVSKRAGDAMVKLERTDLLPQLVDILDEPDPRAPTVKEVDKQKVPVVREMVRINHHRNCLMCHAPGNTGTVSSDTLTAGVPIPGEPLPTPADGYRQSSPDILVRLDVTYLRQDFSKFQPVADANPWPEMQRFDYLVRTRELSEEEATACREKLKEREPGRLSPYHRSALSALRELTGRDTEPTAQAWRKLLDLPAQERRTRQ